MTDWFYDAGGAQKGPVTKDDLIELFKTGQIFARTLVWTKDFGQSWKPFSEANPELVGVNAPPPLPPAAPVIASSEDSFFPWLIALSPILLLGSDRIVRDSGGSSTFSTFIGFAIVTALIVADVRSIRASQRNPEGRTLGAFFWLVPVYLWRRSTVLRQPRWYFGLWWAAFFVYALVSNPSIFSDTTYWGIGTPGCQSASSKSTVKEIFEGTALAKSLGLKVTSIDDIKEVSFLKGERICTMTLATNNTSTYPYRLSITNKGDQWYYQMTPNR